MPAPITATPIDDVLIGLLPGPAVQPPPVQRLQLPWPASRPATARLWPAIRPPAYCIIF
jgi:hypothetical protein